MNLLARVNSMTILGIESIPVEVEVDISKGLPAFDLVGFAHSTVKESRERVRAALKNSGFEFPNRRITVNLAPADIRKEAPLFDLPIALGILAATGQVDQGALAGLVVVGELSLDGSLRPVKGVLPIALGALERGPGRLLVPRENAREASIVNRVEVLAAGNLMEIAVHLDGKQEALRVLPGDAGEDTDRTGDAPGDPGDYSEVQGQDNARRALEIAATGGHNLMMVGPPGSGKTMLARRVPTILPEMAFEESLEVTRIYSISGLLRERSRLVRQRPFRSPHHNITSSALIGGGRFPVPGEVSLAHHGVLYLDEIAEFKKESLEQLRQPMEDGEVTVSRLKGSLTFPARFMLIASLNPCPCGYLGDPFQECKCSYSQVQRYRRKLSGPFLDRIDLFLEVPRPTYGEISAPGGGECSRDIRDRVTRARDIQLTRFKGQGIFYNSQMKPAQLKKYCALDSLGQEMLCRAFEAFNLSGRAYHRLLKVARTVADLEGARCIDSRHLGEALQYRPRGYLG